MPASEPKETIWDVLGRLEGTMDGPSDGATEHDHYLYGTPKRQEGSTDMNERQHVANAVADDQSEKRATSHKLPSLCPWCGKDTIETLVIHGSQHAMHNLVASSWRDSERWKVVRCRSCGHVDFFLNPPEEK